MRNEQVLHLELVWAVAGPEAEEKISAIKANAEPLIATADASNMYRTLNELWTPVGKQIMIPSLQYFVPKDRRK